MPVVESFIISIRLTAAASSADAAIQKKIFGLGTTAPIISNKEIDNVL